MAKKVFLQLVAFTESVDGDTEALSTDSIVPCDCPGCAMKIAATLSVYVAAIRDRYSFEQKDIDAAAAGLKAAVVHADNGAPDNIPEPVSGTRH